MANKNREYSPEELGLEEIKPSELKKSNKKNREYSPEELGLVEDKPVEDQSMLATAASQAANSAALGFGDEGIGAIAAMYQKSTGDSRPFDELYKETRDSIRNYLHKGEKDNPITAFISTLAPNIVEGIPALAGKGFTKALAMGAGYGLGNSESEDIGGMATDTAIGAGVGLGAKAVTGLVGKALSADRFNVSSLLGDTGKTLKEKAIRTYADYSEKLNSRLDILESLNIFKGSKAVRNKITGVFESKGGKLSSKLSPDLPEIERRIINIVEGESESLDKLLNKKSPEQFNLFPLSSEDVDLPLRGNNPFRLKHTSRGPKADTTKVPDFKLRGDSGLIEDGVYTIDDFKGTKAGDLLDDIKASLLETGDSSGEKAVKEASQMLDDLVGDTGFTLKMAREKYKKLYDTVFKMATDTTQPAKTQMYSEVARALSKFVSEKGGPQVAKHNERLSAALHFRSELARKIVLKRLNLVDSFDGAGRRIAVKASPVARAAEGAFAAIEGTTLDRYKATRYAKNLPNWMKEYFGDILPKKASNIMSTLQSDGGRSPQSIEDIAGEIQRFKLPRNSKALLDNPEGVKAKIAQSTDTPELMDAYQESLNDPEQAKSIFPSLAQMAGQLFEHDKYQRFDNIVPVQLRHNAYVDLNNYYSSGRLSLKDVTRITSELNSTGKLILPWEEK